MTEQTPFTPGSTLFEGTQEPTAHEANSETILAEKVLKSCLEDFIFQESDAARNWIFSNDTTEGEFTFVNCCLELGYSPTRLRDQLFREMGKHL